MLPRVVALLVLLAAATALEGQASPYVGLGTRDIKALSAERVSALLEGEGAGYALAAELNGYPGPRHLLDLADSLALSNDQRARVSEIFGSMRAAARDLGRRIVTGEAALDSAFASHAITPGKLAESLSELARLEGELRRVHLAAHLEATALLTPHQIAEYARLRGYGVSGGHRHEHGG